MIKFIDSKIKYWWTRTVFSAKFQIIEVVFSWIIFFPLKNLDLLLKMGFD